MRRITDHIAPADLPQNNIGVEVLDAPSAGGANHAYLISGFEADLNPSRPNFARDRTAALILRRHP